VWTLGKRFLTAVAQEACALVYYAIIREGGVDEETSATPRAKPKALRAH
jgi:hypothetical protein